MAWTLVQHKISTRNGGSSTLAYTSNVTAGNLLVMGISTFIAGPSAVSFTGTCTLSTAWTAAVKYDNPTGNNEGGEIWYAVVGTSGTCTVSVTDANPNVVGIIEFSGNATSTVLGQTATAEQSTTLSSGATGAAATTASATNGDLAIVFEGDAGLGSATEPLTPAVASVAQTVIDSYNEQFDMSMIWAWGTASGTGGQTGQWKATVATSGAFVTITVLFHAGGGGGGGRSSPILASVVKQAVNRSAVF